MRLIDADTLITKDLSMMYKEPTSAEDFMTIGYDKAIADVVVTVHQYPTADVRTKSNEPNRLENAIQGKSPEEIYEFILWLFFRYGKQFTDSKLAIIDWLKGESDGKR